MADADLSVIVDLAVTLAGTGDNKRFQPGTKTYNAMTAVYDRVFPVGIGLTVTAWDSADAAPADWEVGVIQCLTAASLCSVELTGDAVLIGLQLSDLMPMLLPSRDAGATLVAIDGKITLIRLRNPGASIIDVRVMLFGPEAA